MGYPDSLQTWCWSWINNQNWISWFLMFLRDVKVWIDSRDSKECKGMLKIDWNKLEPRLQVAWSAQFFVFRLGFFEAIFLFLFMWYALYIYSRWILGWIEEQILINQCKNYLILYKIKSSLFDPFSSISCQIKSNFEIFQLVWVAWTSRMKEKSILHLILILYLIF